MIPLSGANCIGYLQKYEFASAFGNADIRIKQVLTSYYMHLNLQISFVFHWYFSLIVF